MFRRSLAAWALILAAWGCQSTPTTGGGETAPRREAAPGDSAEALLDTARSASGQRQARLFLEAAELFLARNDVTRAADAVRAIDASRLRHRDSSRYLLARARVELALGNLESARNDLMALDPDALDDPIGFALTSAAVDAAGGAPATAAESLMTVADSTPAPERAQQLSDTIWSYLAQVPPLTTLERASGTQGSTRAWWQLRSAMFSSFTLTEQQRRLTAWREAHPEHPAAQYPPTVLAGLDQAQPNVTRVGLLLPLSGPLGRAGHAVRDAFVASYLEHRNDVHFEMVIYDTSAEPLGALYERALVNGADVLVGPLSKDSVAAMNQLNPEIPVLALNYLAGEPPAANLLQFGLAIEDEAASLGQWLADVGARRILILHNAEEWASRATHTLTESWQGPMTVQALEDIRTVTESVGVAMHVAASEERHTQLEELLGENIEFLPRARGDVDAIVALVTQLEASALVPALKFHFADKVPVYATSQTVRGAGPQRLRELEGFHVAELPWFTLEPDSYRPLNQAFDLEGSPFAALYALGVDAFRLTERAPLIVGGGFTDLLGSTGELTFPANGRIQRRLARTVIRHGDVTNANRSLGR